MKKSMNYVSKYMTKWLIVSAIVGIGGGLSAVFFRKLIDGVSKINTLIPLWLAPAIGGALVCIIYLWDSQAAGFGTDHYIYTVNKLHGKLHPKTFISKLLASALTLGFQGSGGVEGPMVVIGGSLGSMVGKVPFLRKMFSKDEYRILAICGAAGAIGAIFRSPLGGGIFVVEVLYRSSLHYTDLFPAMLSSTMGFILYTMITGNSDPLFSIPNYLPNVFNVPFFILAAIIAGFASFSFMGVFSYVRKIFKKLPLKRLHPIFGGVLTGLVFMMVSDSAGIGISVIQDMITQHKPLTLLVLLFIAKILATSFTIGSGGSGGLVIPALFIGAICGNVLGGLMNIVDPGLTASMVIAGMAACLAGIANVPIAAAVMLTEMVGLRLGVPATLGSIIGYVIGYSKIIYGTTRTYSEEFEKAKHFRKEDRHIEER